jgi:ribonuclease T1
LIAAGGPYPYPRDGIVFGNREKPLATKPNGHYREYTVRTPGESDRGARRIVTGKDSERYYSDDHYASFRAIVP